VRLREHAGKHPPENSYLQHRALTEPLWGLIPSGPHGSTSSPTGSRCAQPSAFVCLGEVTRLSGSATHGPSLTVTTQRLRPAVSSGFDHLASLVAKLGGCLCGAVTRPGAAAASRTGLGGARLGGSCSAGLAGRPAHNAERTRHRSCSHCRASSYPRRLRDHLQSIAGASVRGDLPETERQRLADGVARVLAKVI